MHKPTKSERILNPPKVGEYCFFLSKEDLIELGYNNNVMLCFAETKWRVISKAASWFTHDNEHIQSYFDLENEDGTIKISSIPDEILIKEA